MDAFTQNKCEFEFLGIIKEIANVLDVEIIIETEPFAEGGLRRWFKILQKGEKKNATITIAVVTTLVATILITPIGSALSKSTEILIEKLFEDESEKYQNDLKRRLEIENLKLDNELKRQQLRNNSVITRRKSNFYEHLDKYPKVKNISVGVEDNSKNLYIEGEINKNDFKKFIIISDRLEPVVIDDAIIELVSPVLKKGEYKWRGIYEGEVLPFNMKSNEFKTLVQTGKIEFKNGTSIRCLLEIERKIDNEGKEQTTNYNIVRVIEYFENDKPIETPEGKLHRYKKDADERQTKLWDGGN